MGFDNTMHTVLEKVSQYPYYIMDGVNLDLLKHDKDLPNENILDDMYANSFIPIINRPTKGTKHTCTLIGNVYINHASIQYDNYNGGLTTDITDHFPIFNVSKMHCDHPVDNEWKAIRTKIFYKAKKKYRISLKHY